MNKIVDKLLSEGEKRKSLKGEVKSSVIKLDENLIALMNQLTVTEDIHDRNDLKYFSNVYNETRTFVYNIVIYMVSNQLTGLRKDVDDYIFLVQNILRELKILDKRYKDYPALPEEQSDGYPTKTNQELIRSIKCSLMQMNELKKHVMLTMK
jgi:hypothetical protein